MTWTLIEPFAGSAAFTFHMLAAPSPLVPYQGNKWKLRHMLAPIAMDLGFQRWPSRVVLNDLGPWAVTLDVLTHHDRRQLMIRHVGRMAAEDPREVFDRLQGAQVPESPVLYAAEHLVLERIAFSGKAVGEIDARWRSPGFNATSAYGTEATSRFRAINPQIPALLKRLKQWRIVPADIQVKRQDARELHQDIDVRGPTLVYLDPHYEGTTGYPHGTAGTMEGSLAEAHAWAAKGAHVILSERKGTVHLPAMGNDGSPFRIRRTEGLTILGPK